MQLRQEAEQSSVAVQLTDLSSMLSLTRRLLALRRTHLALAVGSSRSVNTAGEDCFVYLRQHGSQRLLIALNFACAERVLSLAEFDTGRIVLSTYLDREEQVDLAHLALRGDEGCIIAENKV
jgi:alpha-glucosidase